MNCIFSYSTYRSSLKIYKTNFVFPASHKRCCARRRAYSLKTSAFLSALPSLLSLFFYSFYAILYLAHPRPPAVDGF